MPPVLPPVFPFNLPCTWHKAQTTRRPMSHHAGYHGCTHTDSNCHFDHMLCRSHLAEGGPPLASMCCSPPMTTSWGSTTGLVSAASPGSIWSLMRATASRYDPHTCGGYCTTKTGLIAVQGYLLVLFGDARCMLDLHSFGCPAASQTCHGYNHPSQVTCWWHLETVTAHMP